MNNDWKDALSALRGSLDEPEEPQTPETEEKESAGQKGKLTVVTDRKGRNGKTATIIEGFTIPQNEVEKLAKLLKQKLGVGGSVREGEILIQGDHKEKVKKFLKEHQFSTNG